MVKKCGVSQKDIDAVDCGLGNLPERKLNHVPTSYNLYHHKSESEGDDKNRIVEVLT